MFAADSTKRKKKRRFRPWLGIVSWWKRRSFYVAQGDTQDEESLNIDSRLLDQTVSSSVGSPHMTPYFPDWKAAKRAPYRFVRNRTVDSFQGSLESIDSLVESYWDPEDETSQATAVASNTIHPTDFFVEHLGFLSVQTQPRQVEIVYNSWILLCFKDFPTAIRQPLFNTSIRKCDHKGIVVLVFLCVVLLIEKRGNLQHILFQRPK